jgi:hypothetical protein
LIQAGVIAACLQCLAILLLTPMVITFAQSRLDEPDAHVDPTRLSVTSFLQMTYLLIALGLAFTNNRFVDSTAEYIRIASRQMHPLEPNLAANALLQEAVRKGWLVDSGQKRWSPRTGRYEIVWESTIFGKTFQ